MLDIVPVSLELYKKRIKICTECPSYNEKYHQCEECGCFLIAKAFLKPTTCPLNKWPTKEETNE